MSKKTTLSIIIAAHNSEKFLPKTLSSLINALGDRLEDSEIILVNDASQDGTAAILSNFSNNITQARFFSVDFKNPGKVRNFAMNKCKGDYVTMLDSDDLLREGSFTEVILFLIKNTPDMLITKLHEVTAATTDDMYWCGLRPKKLSQHDAIVCFLHHKDFQAHLGGKFIKRSMFDKSPIPDLFCFEDFYVFPELLLNAKNIFFSRTSPYIYLKHSSSLSSTPSKEKIYNLFICIQRMEQFFDAQYSNLILCHWIDFKLKYAKWISSQEQNELVDKKIKITHRIGFFMDPSIRLSYKRKTLSLLWNRLTSRSKKSHS
ncbi:glycosyltransferase family 2 protein [Serratia microhaemolytica]|uniref:glycosyltransferase family 2 protein n=1 Tax=Serratia microhaemolytica TaxID=2675110 RepID=UPI000FDF61ED|nr:glycosyltransferase family 2 protein [Serratia microhaemolytica]